MPTKEEFISSIRTKYPQYESVSDEDLYTRVLTKYPVYKNQIQESQIEEKEPTFLENVGEAITGTKRKVPETEALPSIGDLPELNEMSMSSFKSAIGSLTSNPEETAKILQSNFPKLKVRQDEKGNYIFKSGKDGKEYSIKPGLEARDVFKGLFTGLVDVGAAVGTGLGLGPTGAAIGGGVGQSTTFRSSP